MSDNSRGAWGSKIGFILVASGSAIGLGNIVFFPANAYKYGGGAFYIPYFIALFLIGIPIMMMELSLGRMTSRGLPPALNKVAGKKGEAAGWFGVLNASVITMYYITILGWVVGMWAGCFKSLWEPSAVVAFGIPEGALTNSMSFFFNMISQYDTLVYVILVWLLNILIVMWGTKSIEGAVRWFVPLMWLMMIVLIIRGVTLPNGVHGVYSLFTPDFSVMAQREVWQGAFSQMFFTLSLGFGIMTTYASYLPKDSDESANAPTISLMNCSFEFIAGLAIFSLLFAFAIAPKASTLSMMFFIVPEGIAKFPFGVRAFGLLFFTLLLMAGLSSSVSLVETVVCALLDKFKMARKKAVLMVASIGIVGSGIFALPNIVDPGLDGNGTLGLTLLDLFDHWAFSYGLLITGFLECILLGWVFGADKLRGFINQNARFKIGTWFNLLIRWIIPLVIATILGLSLAGEFSDGLYSVKSNVSGLGWMALGFWLLLTIGGGLTLTLLKGKEGEYDE